MFTRELIQQIAQRMGRPRLVCSCEVPEYTEEPFLAGEYRYLCARCHGYIDLQWILEGKFPEPPI